MKRIGHSPEPIIRKLREADADLAKGVAIPETCEALVADPSLDKAILKEAARGNS